MCFMERNNYGVDYNTVLAESPISHNREVAESDEFCCPQGHVLLPQISGKYISSKSHEKFGHFVNFSTFIFGQKCIAPTPVVDSAAKVTYRNFIFPRYNDGHR